MKSIARLILALVSVACLRAEPPQLFPEGTALNVKAAPWSARGDGTTDDTDALQRALDSKAPLIYLPPGNYLISNTLRWGAGQRKQSLVGAGSEHTHIRLKEKAIGFNIPEQPLSVIWTGQGPTPHPRNSVRKLSIHTGKGNPGAIGLQFITSDQGSIEDVHIVCGESGPIGLDLGHSKDQGPLMLRKVQIRGFDVGISTQHNGYSVTAEGIALEGQTRAGWRNEGLPIAIRGMQFSGPAPALVSEGRDGLAVLLDSSVLGTTGMGSSPALVNGRAAGLFVRHLTAGGYASGIQNQGGHQQNAADLEIAEWSSHPVVQAWEDSEKKTLALPISDTPSVPWDEPADWAKVTDSAPMMIEVKDRFGRNVKVQDWTDSIQRAIDSGKSTVCFPSEALAFAGEIKIRGKVRRLIGLEQTWAARTTGRWIVEDGEAPEVVMEGFDFVGTKVSLIHRSARRLVIRNTSGLPVEQAAGAGDIFLEDVATNRLVMGGGTGGKVWARQLNLEGTDSPRIINDGGTLWILGMRATSDITQIEMRNKARTEVLGGLMSGRSQKAKPPAFIVVDSAFSCVIAEAAPSRKPYTQLVVEQRAGESHEVRYGQAPSRLGGSLLNPFVGYKANP